MGGSSTKDYSGDAYMNAYSAATSGQTWDTINANTSSAYTQVARMAFDSVAATTAAAHEASGAHEASSDTSYEDQLAAQQAQYDEQVESNRIAQGQNDRDDLYASYLDAAGSAADYVNTEISKEKSNAKLLGIDYAITDEQKSSRISDYFSTVWGEGQQTQLEGLVTEFGDPTGFGGYTVTRGSGGAYDTTEGAEKSISTSKGARPTLATEENENALGGTAILGG